MKKLLGGILCVSLLLLLGCGSGGVTKLSYDPLVSEPYPTCRGKCVKLRYPELASDFDLFREELEDLVNEFGYERRFVSEAAPDEHVDETDKLLLKYY